MNYFLLVFNAIFWIVFTIILFWQDKTFDASIAAIIMHIYIAATILARHLKED